MENRKPLVLIVDDVPRNLQVLGNLLRSENLDISVATNGEQAISIATEISPDLILLDVNMPGIDGFEACEYLKENEKTSEIPIIFLTARTETEDIVKGFELGAVDYVTKPINSAELLARVRSHLELKMHRDHLEDLVRERTRDLERAKNDAEAANESKTRFLTNVNHELLTPMNGIIGMNSLMLDTELDEEQKEYAEIIAGSANAQLTIINDVLHFTQMEHGQLILEECELSIRSIVKEINDVLAVRAREKQLNLIYAIDEGVPEGLLGVPGGLRQVLLNLLGNAVKFTEAGEVATRVTVSGRKETGVALLVAVSDTGIGIPQGEMEKIFKPFSQVDDSLTRKYGGLGLGLTNASQLIEMMGGQISVESTEGQGTCFKFVIKLKTAS